MLCTGWYGNASFRVNFGTFALEVRSVPESGSLLKLPIAKGDVDPLLSPSTLCPWAPKRPVPTPNSNPKPTVPIWSAPSLTFRPSSGAMVTVAARWSGRGDEATG